MSSDTTSINQLPSQEISQGQPLNNNNNGQNVNMIVQENSMNRMQNNNDRRLTADDMTDKIRNMNSTISVQPSEIPQSTTQGHNQLFNNNAGAPQQTGSVQQNEMGHLISSVNQLTSQQSTATQLPIHQLHNQHSNIDPMTHVNNIGGQRRGLDEPRFQQPLTSSYYDNTDVGNSQGRKTFYQEIYDELKIPLLICCLFFIFQMPFYRQNLHKHFKFLFQSDGNMNLYGYLSSSVLFSLGYYGLNKVVR